VKTPIPLLFFILYWMLPGMVQAHSMKQVRSEISLVDGKWEASVWLEGWALYPEDGAKIPPGTPGDPNTAGREWLKTLDEADHKVMRDTALMFLDYTYRLTLDGKRLEAEYSFPDYTVPLPELPENEDGNVLMRIDLKGEISQGTVGAFMLEWTDPEDEPMVLSIVKPEPRLLRIEPRTPAVELFMIAADGSSTETEGTSLFGWIIHGFEHILPKGLDHILFILGLFFLQPKAKPLLWQTTSFTLAHSITLALVVLGLFTVPSHIVEPMIALSIAYVGLENLWVKELKPWRIGLVFGLGLLHGMGFASVMKELEIPEGAVLKPLIGFNLGVEIGQITVLASAFAATFMILKKPAFGIVRKAASLLIGTTGLYWTVERIWF
jgi:hydrogenase/urease accessory protein HupE